MTKFDRSKIQWDDEDQDFDFEQSSDKNAESTEFASLLGGNDAASDQQGFIEVGDQVTGPIMTISQDKYGDVAIDLGSKYVGLLPKSEVTDEFGDVTVKVGESLTATVVSRRGTELSLSKNPAAAVTGEDALQDAFENKIAVKGKVTGQNKGGFEVTVAGKRGFCPVSKMDTKFVQDKNYYMGKEFEFLIEKLAGRDMVVSRRAFIEREQALRFESLLSDWQRQPETIYEGSVIELRDFGAIVRFPGGEGMVHVSELSHSRVAKASDVVSIGDVVRFKILKVDQSTSPPRISLSMKQTSQDPWDTLSDQVQTGESYTGRVTRLQPFGAFVELKPGIEGVIHISEMSWEKRVHDPSEILSVGDTLEVRVLSVDLERQRIGLSMKHIQDDPWFGLEARYQVGQTYPGKVTRLKGFGAICELAPGVSGMVPKGVLEKAFGQGFRKSASPEQTLEVVIQEIDRERKRIRLSLPKVEADDSSDADYREYLAEQGDKQKAPGPGPGKSSGSLGSFGELLQASLKKK